VHEYSPLAILMYDQTAAWANAQPSLLEASTMFRPSPPPFVKDLRTKVQAIEQKQALGWNFIEIRGNSNHPNEESQQLG